MTEDELFLFVDDFFSEAAEKEKSEGTGALSDLENTVVQVWHASGLIENGGFRYLISASHPDLDLLASSYEDIGLLECTEIILNVKKLIPNDYTDPDKMKELLDKHDKALDVLSENFWQADKSIASYLYRYIQKKKTRPNPDTLAEEEMYEFVEDFYLKTSAKIDDPISQTEGVVLFIWCTSVYMKDGGFGSVLMGRLNSDQLSVAYEIIGQPLLGKLMLQIKTLIPGEYDDDEIQGIVDKHKKQFEPLAVQFRALNKETPVKLYHYINKHG